MLYASKITITKQKVVSGGNASGFCKGNNLIRMSARNKDFHGFISPSHQSPELN
jgi:hypothetical protein